jgi:hypothetical protein
MVIEMNRLTKLEKGGKHFKGRLINRPTDRHTYGQAKGQIDRWIDIEAS